MKYFLLFLLLAISTNLFAQKITGIVTDKSTKQPINGAIVILGSAKTFSNNLGVFEITLNDDTDTIEITHFAYKKRIITVNTLKNLLHIELEPAVISLNIVNVRGTRHFRQDSIENRNSYAKQFNYTGPKVIDAFKGGLSNPVNNTSQILNINLLTLVSALTKKSATEYKFNKILIRDEQADFIDRRFNRGSVSAITGLKADTLSTFLVRYRPDYKFAKKASDYEMISYVKDSYNQFAANCFKAEHIFK